MGTGYIIHQDGTEEVISYSCDGAQDFYCEKCQKVTMHWLSGVSNIRGYVWQCSECYQELNPYNE